MRARTATVSESNVHRLGARVVEAYVLRVGSNPVGTFFSLAHGVILHIVSLAMQP